MASKVFSLVIIKPTHYDDDGYPIQWMTSAIPSNTLAALNGLAEDCRARGVLGPDVDLRISTYDETNKRVHPHRIIKELKASGGPSLVAMVGVQSNQFPRAMDLSRVFRAAGLQVAIGGFHISGCISMLDELPDDIKEAEALGISLFAGEAEEERLDEVLCDAQAGTLKSLYNWMDDLPTIAGEPIPILPAQHINRTAGSHSSFDLGRGCPFQCSFCTIINVQGRKSRFRTPDDLEKIIRENYAQGINRFFITDDNFARNKDWEAFVDRLIELRHGEKMNIKFVIQVDTLCHRIPNFIPKCRKAGVTRVFIGLENINPDNLAAANKKQNRIVEYREMLQEWKRYKAITYAGYILGFPGDTYESIMRDIEIIKRELPLDLLEFFYLTPLPGSADHKTLLAKGIWMDPDMNKYDLNHRCSHHEKMSDDEWDRAYRDAWTAYYSTEHMATIMRRNGATRCSVGNILWLMIWFAGCVQIEGVHPLEGGFFRRKFRRDRRPGLPVEQVWSFYPKYWAGLLANQVRWLAMLGRVYPAYRAIKRDPDKLAYMDMALKPVDEDHLDDLEMIAATRGGETALAKTRHDKAIRDAARAKAGEPRKKVSSVG